MINKLEKISVIMCSFNDELSIDKSIQSIRNQTYDNLEILVLDDGSSDNTYNLLKSMEAKDSRLKIFKNEKNIGLTKSLNLLINNSSANLIARHDADDESHPQRFEYQIDAIKNHNLDFCTTRSLKMRTLRKIPNLSYYAPSKILIKYKNPFIHGSLMIKKDVIKEIGSYDENFYYAQDYKLFIDLIRKNYRYKVLRKPLYFLNMDNNISTNYRSEQAYYAYCARKKIKPE